MDEAYDYYDIEHDDDIVDRHRNWPIYSDVGGELYVIVEGVSLYCSDIDDAKKEIDKSIKKWGKRRATR